jgi:hypothetical protein
MRGKPVKLKLKEPADKQVAKSVRVLPALKRADVRLSRYET